MQHKLERRTLCTKKSTKHKRVVRCRLATWTHPIARKNRVDYQCQNVYVLFYFVGKVNVAVSNS